MARIKNRQAFMKSAELLANNIRTKLANDIAYVLIDSICEECPVQDGHVHTSILAGADKINSVLPGVGKAIAKHGDKESGDPIARAKGIGRAVHTNNKTVIKAGTALPFAYKMENGITIIVGDLRGKQGPKTEKVIRPDEKGALYGPRYPRELGRGVLAGKDGYGSNFQGYTSRQPDANEVGFFSRAISKVKEFIRHYKSEKDVG